jgi:hypothetical protein
MKLEKLREDKDLVTDAFLNATGANTHEINRQLGNYRMGIYTCNMYAKAGKTEDYSKKRKQIEERERTLRSLLTKISKESNLKKVGEH